MKYSTCQLVQNGVIRGVVHYIRRTDPIRPLCDRFQIRVCEGGAVDFLPTDLTATCKFCVNVTNRTPVMVDVPTIEWIGA